MKLNLFALRNTATGRVVPDLHFGDKKAAKAKRDELNKEGLDSYVVTPGPDHHKSKASAQA